MHASPHRQATQIAAVIVAAGKGLRSGQDVPKQFAVWQGKPVLRHAVDRLRAAGVGPVCIAIPEGCEALAQAAIGAADSIALVPGGETRQASVKLALEALPSPCEIVLIHDAARPDCPPEVVQRLVAKVGEGIGAVPVLPVVDAIVSIDGGFVEKAQQREHLRRVQTPQAFRYGDILAAHHQWDGLPGAGDDAQVFRAAGGKVALVEGDKRLHKLTYAEDFMSAPAAPPKPPRIGTGYDVHRLAAGEELWLCGIQLAHDKGLAGHSDADVALHAVVDAIFGALGEGDIGQHFPPSDPQWKGAQSSTFVTHAAQRVSAAGFAIGNIDLTIICEAPKIGPHRLAMQERLAQLLSVRPEAINVKATTTERLGFAGRGEGIAAQAAVLLFPCQE